MTTARFGMAVSMLRDERGLTQHQLAVRMNTSASVISKIERGVFDPRVETFEKIGRALGMQAWEVLRFAYRLQETIDTRSEDEPRLTPALWRAA
jgi:transcriptional regulator with XRE-family HTH domain